MAYQQKEGQGSLFKNEKQNDRQPDFKGTILIKGVLYEVAAWNRTAQNGKEYISLQASERNQNQQQGYQAPQPSYQTPQPSCTAPGLDDIPAPVSEDDLPF